MTPGRPITSTSQVNWLARKKTRERRDRGHCQWCGRRAKRINGQLHTLCARCRARNVASQRRDYEAMKQARLCTNCGAQSNGLTRCPSCAKRRNDRRRQLRRDRKLQRAGP